VVQNPPEGMQRVIPYLVYEDAPAAIAFLTAAFGFEERYRFPAADGRVGHAELGYGDSVLMLASTFEEMGHASPRDLPAHHGSVHCYVDDVDAHCERAWAVGATITAEPDDKFYGDRVYTAEDREGHRWSFATRVRDVRPEELSTPEAEW